LKQIFPEKELHSPSPNFHIDLSLSDLYIPTIHLPILWKYVALSWEYINRSQTHECGTWNGCRAIPEKKEYLKGIFVAVHAIFGPSKFFVFFSGVDEGGAVGEGVAPFLVNFFPKVLTLLYKQYVK
jgi:hypothetical protein